PIYVEFVFNFLENFTGVATDERTRPNHGFLTPENWRAAFRAAGFERPEILPDVEELSRHYEAFFVAAVSARRPRSCPSLRLLRVTAPPVRRHSRPPSERPERLDGVIGCRRPLPLPGRSGSGRPRRGRSSTTAPGARGRSAPGSRRSARGSCAGLSRGPLRSRRAAAPRSPRGIGRPACGR